MKETKLPVQVAGINSNGLKIDYCNYDAAKFAVENYHYSHSMPAGKSVKFGVWEEGKFIGAVLFGVGVQNNLVIQYGLKRTEGCELTRIALTKHKSSVTRIVSICLRRLKQTCPGIRLVVSFADANQGHLGKIYQAGNWIYTGMAHSTPLYYFRGKWRHQRSIGALGFSTRDWAGPEKPQLNKYRYLMPLDNQLRGKLIKLAQPYPHASVV